MIKKFECGKIYKFTQEGEELPVEHSYQTFFKNIDLNKDEYGYYSNVTNYNDISFVMIPSGTIALCIGDDEIKLLSYNLKTLENHKYYRLLIGEQIVMLLHKEKNLYSVEEMMAETD